MTTGTLPTAPRKNPPPPQTAKVVHLRASLPPSKLAKLVAGERDEWCPPASVPPDAARDLVRQIIRREEAQRPATEREIAVVLGRLSIHFSTPDRPEEIHRFAAEDWLDDLVEYPLAVLNEAATEWRRSKPWAPKISEMRALCDGIVGRRRTELLRVRYLAWCVEHHSGRCPRLLRRIGDRLVDYGDRLFNHLIQAALAGRTEFPPGDLVLAVPGAARRPAYDHIDFSQIFRPMPPGKEDSGTDRQPAPLPPFASLPAPSTRRKVSGFSRDEIEAGALDASWPAPQPPPAPDEAPAPIPPPEGEPL